MVRRRKWIILQAVVLVPAAAVAFSLQQEAQYEATAEVLLSRQNLASALTGTPDPAAYQQADRLAQTQASLARVPEVADRVLGGNARPEAIKAFLDASDVSAKQNADLLVFRVRDGVAAVAERLATAYAREFTAYRRELDTDSLERARLEVSERIAQLEDEGQTRSALYADLVGKEQQLRTMEALQTSNAFVVREAQPAEQVQPRPMRNAVLGLALGLVLGLGLAFLWEALDTRVRRAEEIGRKLRLPLLARLPEPPKRLRSEDRLVMLAEPSSPQAEAFRMLRMNLEFARLDRDVRTIMVTSAVEQEGKSTTAANLAVALARGGQRVILADLDLRRPFQSRFFHVEGRPGLTQVVLGHAALQSAVTPVSIGSARPPAKAVTRVRSGNGNGNGSHAEDARGALAVLAAGPAPPDPGEFVGSQRLAALLSELRERADVVIVDAPPSLQVGDAMALSAQVDAVLVVTRLKALRRGTLTELARVLETMPAAKLGYVVTGAEEEDGYGYEGYGYGYGSYTGEPADEREHEAVR